MKASRLAIFICFAAIVVGFNGLTADAAFVVEEVVWTNVSNAVAIGNSLDKAHDCSRRCISGGMSRQEIFSGDGYMEFTASGRESLYAGLSRGNIGYAFEEIDFAIRLQGGKATVWENGVNKEAGVNFRRGDVFRIGIVSGIVEYSKNGTVFYRSDVPPAYPLLVDTSLVGRRAVMSNAVIAGILSTRPPEPSYAIADLGLSCCALANRWTNGAGDWGVYGIDINNAGQVVVTSDDRNAVFLWENGVLKEVDLPYRSYPVVINNLGHLAGGSQAFLWREGALTDLDTRPEEKNSRATGINDFGQVVGLAWYPPPHWDLIESFLRSSAFLWQDGTMRFLGTIPGTESSAARDVNNVGQIVGSSWHHTNNPFLPIHAFLWQDGVMQDLGSLPDYVRSTAYAINDLTQVVGVSSGAATGWREHAVLWQDGMMHDLLPEITTSSANDINNSGQIVGWFGNIVKGVMTRRAFIWQERVMYDLNSFLPEDSGWVLETANAINDNGQIVGTGLLNGVRRGFLLDPIPSSDVLVASR